MENYNCSKATKEERLERPTTSSIIKCMEDLVTKLNKLQPRVDDVIEQRKQEEELFHMSTKQVSQSIDGIGVLFEKAAMKMKDSLQTLRQDLSSRSKHTCSQHALTLKKEIESDIARYNQLSKCFGEYTEEDLLKELDMLRNSSGKYEATMPDLVLAEKSNTLHLLADDEFVTMCRTLVDCDHSLDIVSSKGVSTEELKLGDGGNRICFGVKTDEIENSNVAPICEIHAKSGNSWKNEICSFSDVALISNTVLVVDRQRLKVKRYNLEGEMIDWVRIHSPHGLAALRGTDDVIVTQPTEKSLARVSTTTGLKITRTSRVEFPYYVIREMDDTCLAVSTIAAPADMLSLGSDQDKSTLAMNTRIHLIKHDGQLLKVLSLTDVDYEKLHGTNLFPDFESFTIPNHDRIAIRLTDMAGNNFVAYFTREGQPLWLYTASGTIHGLTYRAGLLYVYIGDMERKLTVLTSAGKPIKTVNLGDYSGKGNIMYAGERGVAMVDFSNIIRVYPYP